MQETGVLRIGIDPSFPPFLVDDGKGNLSGFDIALAGRLAAEWGLKIEYVYTGYDGLYDALSANQFDMILSALPYNPGRTQDVLFTHSYFDDGPVLVVPGSDNSTAAVSALSGRTVAVELGSGGDAYARVWRRPFGLDVRSFGTAAEALLAVQQGQAAGAIVEPIAFYDFGRANPAPGLKMVGKPLRTEYYVMAVRKDAPVLLQQIDAIIDRMKEDGSLQELQRRWF